MSTLHTATEPPLVVRGNGSALTETSLTGDLGAEYGAQTLIPQLLPPPHSTETLRTGVHEALNQYFSEHLRGAARELLDKAFRHVRQQFPAAELNQLAQDLADEEMIFSFTIGSQKKS
jgi:hypothetical protein